MKKITLILIFTLAVMLNSVMSQEVYLIKEECLVNIVSYNKWETGNYSGSYEYGYPATPNPDGTEADGFGYELTIDHSLSGVKAYYEGFVEVESERQLLNETSITDNKFYSTELNGEFIEAKCKTHDENIIYVKGLLVKDGSYINFYELINY